MNNLRKTQLNATHHKLGAKMVEFAGYEMPIRYSGVNKEHHQVRDKAGLFDLGHMGRLIIKGQESCSFLDYVVSNNIAKMKPGDARYALVLNEQGTVLDDVIVYHCEKEYFVVCNGANREKIVNWLQEKASGFAVEIKDVSDEMGMIAVQGPASEKVMCSLVNDPGKIKELKYYKCTSVTILGRGEATVLVARTGYTGEDGFELYLSNEVVSEVWDEILAHHPDLVIPAGLAARDTLRLEAAMPLYGQEITQEHNPLEAGLSFAVKLNKENFIGKEALSKVKEEGVKQRLVCLVLESKRIARTHSPVTSGGKQVGYVTSGTLSPTLGKSIALAYLSTERDPDAPLEIQIKDKLFPAKIIPRPFYSRA